MQASASLSPPARLEKVPQKVPEVAARPLSLGYMPQLDGLRALAVLAVIFYHLAQARLPVVLQAIGPMGVRLFFVLSGFLITSILFDCRDRALREGSRDGSVQAARRRLLRQFYIRRVLRIFPIYYLVLIVAFCAGFGPVRDAIAWHLSYTSNLWLANLNRWPEGVSHLWSLSVEEQFYLLWPCLMLWTPRRFLLPLIVATIALGPLYRLSVVLMHWHNHGAITPLPGNYIPIITPLPANFDTLGAGALLAYGRHYADEHPFLEETLLWVLGCIGGGALIFLLTQEARKADTGLLNPMFRETAMAMLFFWLVARASRGFEGKTGAFLQTPILLYLGKISYGLYLLHLFVPLAIVPTFAWLGWDLPNPVFKGMLNLVVTGVAASLSWHLFEKPLNDLKRFFPYTSRRVVKTRRSKSERVLPSAPTPEGVEEQRQARLDRRALVDQRVRTDRRRGTFKNDALSKRRAVVERRINQDRRQQKRRVESDRRARAAAMQNQSRGAT